MRHHQKSVRTAREVIRGAVRTSHVLNEAIAALAAALSGCGMAISLAALVFTGPLEGGLPRAISSFVLAGAIVAGFVGWRSQLVPAASIVQDGPAVVMVAVAAGVAARGGDGATVDVFVMLALTTLATGTAMWLFGRFGLGNLARYIPATVVSAFIAGTGYLLTKGGLDVMVGFGIGLDTIGDLLEPTLLKLWLPGAALGVAIWLVQRSPRLPPVAMSVSILASLAVFYTVVAAFSSIDAVEQGGWLIGPFSDSTGIHPVTPGEVSDANWGHIVGESAGIFSVIGVAVIALLLNLSGLELVGGERIDVDRELKSTGIANLLMAPFGAPPGFHALGDTVLVRRMGATRRAVPVLAATLMAVFGVLGTTLVGYVPRLVVGGLLVTVGVGLLAEWATGLLRTVSTVDRIVSVGIVAVIATVGILEGIAVGVVAACAVFVFRYSRIDPVRRVATGAVLRSRVDRTPADAMVLSSSGDRTLIYQLQGYLFFGSLTMLEDRVSAACDDPDGALDAMIVDFHHVTGIDSSGYALIGQLVDDAAAVGAIFVVSGLDLDVRVALVASEPVTTASVRWFDTLDEALEHVENGRVADVDRGQTDEAALPFSPGLSDRFERTSCEAGTVAFRQGDRSDDLVIVRRGSLTAFRVDDDGTRHRLRRFATGAVIGEIGLITGRVRTAEVVADTDVEMFTMNREEYRALRREAPELAFELHELILRSQAERVAAMSLSLTEQLR